MRKLWTISIALVLLLEIATGVQAAVKINAWTGLSGDDKGRFEEMITAFNASQKDVEVVPSFYQWDLLHSKLVASVQTGGAPEMLLMWVTVLPEMVSMGALQPMDELLGEAGIKGDDFIPRAWSLAVIGGKRYGVPMDTHLLGLYYNTELFEKAGLDPNKPPVTMDEFVTAAKKLTVGPNQWGVAIPSSTAWPVRYWMGFLHQEGGKMFTNDLKKAAFNDAKGKAAFQFMSDLIHVHKVAPPVMTDINKAFLTKQAAMILIGPWLINSALNQEGLKFKTAPMPKIFGEFGTWGMSHQLVLGKQPDRAKQLAAMKFIRYMSENSLTWVKGGQAPARRSILNGPEFKSMTLWHAFTPGIQPESGWVLNPPILQQTKIFTHDPASPMVAAWESIVQKKKTVDQALADAEKGVNTILAGQ
ncbi:MAG TPA: ABC transporter substrate-binding protein [archaeon]|nr:ABC transporter substrate-binding protein [archaeon]